MPRDPSGIYTLPPGTDAIPNRTILSSPYNLSVHDIEADLNTPRPIIAGGTGASTATEALKNLGAMPVHGLGQCYLSKVVPTTSSSPLILSPENGNLIFINGKVEVIPDAGVQLAPTAQGGNASNTFYYIYVYMNSGVMTLEFSTTGWSVQAGSNIKIKTGDPTRTLVGLASSYTSNNTWSNYFTDICSLFNPKDKTWVSPRANTSTISTTLTPIAAGLAIPYVSFPEREVVYKLFGIVNQTVNTASITLDGLNDSTAPCLFVSLYGASMLSQPYGAGGNWEWIHGEIAFSVAGNIKHSVQAVYCGSTGTTSFAGNNSVTIKG